MEKMNFESIKQNQTAEQIFTNMDRYVEMVIKRIQPSVLLTGAPGMGKTYLVKKALDAKGFTHGDQYRIIKGSTTAAGLYRALYMNRGKIIVFDDCDSVFKDADGVNLLKGALDSYDDRWISWIAGNGNLKDDDGHMIPSQFEFKGAVIFISNLSQGKIDSAIRSRSFTVDIDLSPEQLIQRMEDKLPEMETKVPMNIKMDALKALKQVNSKFEGVELNFRSLIKAIRIRQTDFPNWPQMIAEQCIDPNYKASGSKKTAPVLNVTGKTPTKEVLNTLKNEGHTWGALDKAFGLGSGKARRIANS
jgi:hypothetical protein